MPLHLANGPDHLGTGHPRHVLRDQHNIGTPPLQQLKRFVAMTSPVDHVTSLAQEGERQAAHQRVIIDNQHLRHFACSNLLPG